MAENCLDDFLSQVEKGRRERLREKFSSENLDRGQFVFFEGDPASSLYVVESGVIEANLIHGDGKVFIFHFLFPGDLVGEGVAYGQSAYPFSAVARKDASLWKIKRDDLLPVLRDDDGLERYFIDVLGKKLEDSYIKTRCIAGERVEKRVACILLKTIGEHGIFDRCGERIDTPLTNRDISGLIGSTEETVSRIMSRLKKNGIVGIEDKRLVVVDRQALLGFFDSV